ncbi:GGDEF domain-containing response regulator [Arenimonas sp.]|uniref:GGDEF domain-containing response regulator n=1 Tax=Arenimonas sp. TaxID=1872635 RepID=UPI002E371610|nr:response regulator [Arenimonas sp.]HEX4854803.1 response regulator [Arenimonas sp.]
MSGDSGAKARILVVDDSKLMRKAAVKMLGDEFDVVTADDGAQAWQMVGEDQSIQVVFSDLNMPVSDGYELLRRVRASADAGVQSLPLIIVTGAENDEAARMKALDMGATDFITKPFSTTDLVARARAHANNQRITRQLQAQSTLDGLTGLSNKAGFLDRLQQDIAYARRHQQPLCLVRLEMVDFRRFFLYHGREVAEALVLQVARMLRGRIRKEDTAARIGLGGFALSLPGGDPAGIEGMIGRLRLELLGQPPVDENGDPIAVELGAAVLCPDLGAELGAQAMLDQCQAMLDAASVAPAPAAAGAAPVVHVETSIVPLAAPAAAPSATSFASPGPASVPAVPELAAAAAPDAVPVLPEAVISPAIPAAPEVVAPAAAMPAAPTAPPAPAAPAAPVAPLASTAPVAPVAPAAPTAPAAAPAPATPAAPAAPEPLRLDPLLDELAAGNARAVAEKMPQVIGRLLPVLRLLGPGQRAQLIQFLQRLG